MLKTFKKISDIADKISLFIASLMVLGILSVSIYGAFMRYIMNSPVPWPLPVGRLLMIWSGSIGIAAALKRGQHMGVDGFIIRFPQKVEKIIRYIGFGFVSIFVLTLFWYGIMETYYAGDQYMLTASTRISYRWLNAAIPVGAFIQFLHLLSAPYVVKEFMEKDYTETDIKSDGEIGL